MRMTQKSVLSMSAVMMVAALAACSDSPTAPSANVALGKPSFAAGDPVGTVVTSTPVLGQVIICKAGNVGGTFDLSARLTAGGTVPSSIGVTNGQCKIAYINNSGSGVGAFVTVTEQSADNTVQTRTSCTVISQEDGAPAGTTTTASCSLAANSEYFTNSFHGYVVTFTNTFTEPPVGCTFTQGYWKTHGPAAKGNNTNVWPVSSLTLGTVTYTASQLQSILDAPVKGNGLISLAHQLIAAKLNIANGASGSSIASTITAADALIGSLVVPPVGGGSLDPAVTAALTDALDAFNSGLTGPGHCGSEIL
jgi:hypothetical protein